MSVPGKREQMGNGKREQMGNAEAAHRSREQTGNVQKPSGTVKTDLLLVGRVENECAQETGTNRERRAAQSRRTFS